MKKYSVEEVLSILSKQNLKPINIDEYKNSKTKITLINSEGYMFLMSVGDVLSGNNTLKPFSTLNPYTINNIKTYLKNNNYVNELISSEYNGFSKTLVFTCCECREEYEVTFNHFVNAKQIRCKKCAKKYGIDKRKNNKEDVEEYFRKRGLILLDEYERNDKRMSVMDEYGFKSMISYTSLKTSDSIKYYSNSNPYSIYNIRHYIEMNSYNVELLSDKYTEGNLEFKCECGETFKTTFKSFRFQHKIRCDRCSKKQSHISYLTEKYLKERGVKYIREYKIEDCKYRRVLPFDFAIFINDKIKLLECDGIQHFKPIEFNGCGNLKAMKTHETTRRNDLIKNEYCEINKINLIRIPYYEFENGNYINILNLICI